MLSAEAIGFKTIIHLNITEHFKKRVYKFVRWTFHTSEARVMPPEEYKSHKLAMLQIANDLLRVETATLVSPVEFHPWINQYRSFFHLDVLLQSDSFEAVEKVSPQLFLPALTHKFRPGFVM